MEPLEAMLISVFGGLRNVENIATNNTRLRIATPATSTKIHHMRLFLIRHAETVSMSSLFDDPK
jgi:phosphotransferase system IIB component